MKSFAKYFGVVAGMAALLVSCNKQEEVFVPEDKTVEMTIVASSDETKTVLGSDGTVTWLASGEQLAVIEAAVSGTSTTTAKETSSVGVTNDGGATMSFGVKMPAKAANSFGYYALYPNSAYVEKPTDLAKVKVDLASTQYPTESSFGPSADVLVAKPVTGLTTQPTELNLQFARVIAVGKMTIKDLSTAENVKKVTFTATGKTVTGRSYIDFTTAAGVTYGYSGQGVDNVVLDYSGKTIAANGMAAYFTCWPFELGARDTFSVVVETENYTFTKNITLAEGKSLAFKVGRASAFNVSFSGIKGVEKATATATVTYTVTSTSAVSVSGVAPSGSSATYSSTCDTKNQLTGGSSMTLTLSGYKGMIVKGLTLSMKSNSSKGAGYLSVKVGDTTLGSIGSSSSGVKFNTASWYGNWSTSYVDVKPTLSNNAYTIQNGEDLVIVIGATANSLYCQSFTIEYVADPSFVGGGEPGGGEPGGGEPGGGEPGGAKTTTLSNANITAVVNPNNNSTQNTRYRNLTYTDDNGFEYSANAISTYHSKATSQNCYIQIKKYASNTAYYVKLPQFTGNIKSIHLVVSGSSKAMNGGGNTATIFFSSSNSTSEAGNNIVSGEGTSEITIDASSLNLNTGYLTANGAVRIWEITVEYSE